MTDTNFNEQEAAFLLELNELSRKHGIIIHGCGCCGSPSLYPVENPSPEAGYGTGGMRDFEWIEPDSCAWEEGLRPLKPVS